MPVARIIVDHPTDAETVSRYLAHRGYTVEVVPPGTPGSLNAELQLRVERCPVEVAMARVASQPDEVARFVAPGVFGALPKAEPPRAVQPRAVAQELPRRREKRPSRLHILSGEVAAVLARAGDAAADGLRDARRAASRLITQLKQSLATRRERQRAGRAEGLRRAQKSAAQQQAQRQRQRAEVLRRQQSAALPKSVLVTPGMEIPRIVSETQKNPVMPPAAIPNPSPEKAETTGSPGFAPPVYAERVQQPEPVRATVEKRTARVVRGPERRQTPRRPRRPLPARWRGAFAAAALSALVLMVGWGIAASGGPPAPPSSQSDVRQAMPFGPVTLFPSAPAAKAPSARPTAAPVVPRAAKPKASAPVRAARPAARDSSVAEDEVIVHRYARPQPPPQSANKREPRKYSDMQ